VGKAGGAGGAGGGAVVFSAKGLLEFGPNAVIDVSSANGSSGNATVSNGGSPSGRTNGQDGIGGGAGGNRSTGSCGSYPGKYAGQGGVGGAGGKGGDGGVGGSGGKGAGSGNGAAGAPGMVKVCGSIVRASTLQVLCNNYTALPDNQYAGKFTWVSNMHTGWITEPQFKQSAGGASENHEFGMSTFPAYLQAPSVYNTAVNVPYIGQLDQAAPATHGILKSSFWNKLNVDAALSSVQNNLRWCRLEANTAGCPLTGFDQICIKAEGSALSNVYITVDGNPYTIASIPSGAYWTTMIPDSATFSINRRPVMTQMPNVSENEGETVSFQVTASDPDGTIPSLGVTPTEFSAYFTDLGNGTGQFSWTTGYDDAENSPYSLTFTASDGSLTDSKGMTLTITNTNRPPVLAPLSNQSALDGETLSFLATATDPDGYVPPNGAALTLTASGQPGGNFGPTTYNAGQSRYEATFTWNVPGGYTAGTYGGVVIQVTDNHPSDPRTDSRTIAFVIGSSNKPPTLDTIGGQAVPGDNSLVFNVQETATLSLNIAASDPDAGDTLTLSASGTLAGENAAGFFTDYGNGTGNLTWTPGYEDQGVYTNIVFEVSDSRLNDLEAVTIVVTNKNREPVLGPLENQTAIEGTLLTYQVTATDPDGGIPSLSAAGLPPGATFSDHGAGTGTLTWLPGYSAFEAAPPGGYSVTFTASDGMAQKQGAITIIVQNTNRAPILYSFGDQAAAPGDTLVFHVHAADPDGTTPLLNIANSPGGAFVDHADGTGTYTWTTRAEDAGVYSGVIISASDGELSDSRTFTIIVGDPGLVPRFAPIGDQEADEGTTLRFLVYAYDNGGAPLVLTAENLPSGATFSDQGNSTGVFDWDIDYKSAGIYENVVFLASNGVYTGARRIRITVRDVDAPPVLDFIGDKTVEYGNTLTFTINANDADGDIPGLAITTPDTPPPLPGGYAFIDHGNGSGTFTWATSASDEGLYHAKFLAIDLNRPALSDSEEIRVAVVETNHAPVLAPIGNKTVNEGEELRFTVTATDPDGTRPLLSMNNAPAAAVFTDHHDGTGTFSWATTYADAGTYPGIGFAASDGLAQHTEAITIQVNDVSLPPAGTLSINGGAEITPRATVTLNLTAQDRNGHGVAWMRFRNEGGNWGAWEPFQSTRPNWLLPTGDGFKTVQAQLRDGSGGFGDDNVSAVLSAVILLDAAPMVVEAVEPRVVTETVKRTHTFEVRVSGNNGTPEYQWYFESTGSKSSVLINGATSATYTTPPLELTDTGFYHCAVTAYLETEQSPAFTLTVVPGLPAASALGLALAALITALAGAATVRRRT